MNIVCLDLEGVLVPEIWIAFAEATGISELRRTTRDEPDYDKLMSWRLDLLKKNGLKLGDIQKVISGMEPLDGAREFIEKLRERSQLIILSDTFEQFAQPLMRHLGWPTLFCNSLTVNEPGEVTGYELRQPNGKKRAVEGLKAMGFTVSAAGDSYNDVAMLQTADKGFFFRPPQPIISQFPEIPVAQTHQELFTLLFPSSEAPGT
ncbi:MAG: bifunctional phosphoserine phosphatase/homoserine phosphotransferase ThrH [Spirochaetales bacterium]|jgi:phosphoserine/homoserine phosphotransferase|nr:bifunctional phosphoserine phosphatase/homoserine phosphotransferase ThrH [Spirochaetales bacterium]